MKMVCCACDISVLDELLRLIDESKALSYQVIDECTGKLPGCLPKMNNAVWPGHNSLILIQFSATDEANSLIESIQTCNRNETNVNEKITCFSLTLTDFLMN